MFSYGPGRVPPPAHLGIPPALIAGSFAPGNVVNSVRQAKRIYIGNITDAHTEEVLRNHFTKLMKENNLAAGDLGGDIVQEVGIDEEKRFAFIEVSCSARYHPVLVLMIKFRTPDEATGAMQFDGETIADVKITVKPPKDYIGIDTALGTMAGGVGMTVSESPNKLFIGGLPTYLNDEQVMELMKSFGELKSFNLVKDGTASKVSVTACSSPGS
jgi:splicing factor U2AF subunit